MGIIEQTLYQADAINYRPLGGERLRRLDMEWGASGQREMWNEERVSHNEVPSSVPSAGTSNFVVDEALPRYLLLTASPYSVCHVRTRLKGRL